MFEPPPPAPSESSAPPPGQAAVAHKAGSLAALLTVAAPGMGHVYLEVDGPRRTRAFILLAATVAVVLLSCFVSFPIAAAIYLAAVALALADLRDERPASPFADLGAGLSWWLVAGGGLLLAVSLLLPWYRESVGGVTLGASGRYALSVIDWVLAMIGIACAVLGVVGLTRRSTPRPVAVVVAAAGAIALALVVFRLVITPGGLALDIERSFGVLLAFAAAVLLAGGAAGAATSKS